MIRDVFNHQYIHHNEDDSESSYYDEEEEDSQNNSDDTIVQDTDFIGNLGEAFDDAYRGFMEGETVQKKYPRQVFCEDNAENPDDLKQRWKCLICMDIVIQPKECSKCEKIICGECIDTWLRSRRTCPGCKESWAAKTQTHIIFRNELAEIKYKCPCQYSLTLDNYHIHIKNCQLGNPLQIYEEMRKKCFYIDDSSLISNQIDSTIQFVLAYALFCKKKELKVFQDFQEVKYTFLYDQKQLNKTNNGSNTNKTENLIIKENKNTNEEAKEIKEIKEREEEEEKEEQKQQEFLNIFNNSRKSQNILAQNQAPNIFAQNKTETENILKDSPENIIQNIDNNNSNSNGQKIEENQQQLGEVSELQYYRDNENFAIKMLKEGKSFNIKIGSNAVNSLKSYWGYLDEGNIKRFELKEFWKLEKQYTFFLAGKPNSASHSFKINNDTCKIRINFKEQFQENQYSGYKRFIRRIDKNEESTRFFDNQ